MKKKNKTKTNSSQFLTRIASHPRNNTFNFRKMIFLNYLTPRRTQQNIMVSKTWTTTFQFNKRRRSGRSVSPPHSPMWRAQAQRISISIYNGIIVTKFSQNFHNIFTRGYQLVQFNKQHSLQPINGRGTVRYYIWNIWKNVTKKFNYMLLFMKDYIYTKKSFLPIFKQNLTSIQNRTYQSINDIRNKRRLIHFLVVY